MKKLGTLYGVGVLLDTDDERIFELSEKYLETQRKRLEKLSEMEMELHVAAFEQYRPTFWKTFKKTLFKKHERNTSRKNT